MLLGDIGQTALLASRRELERAELTLFARSRSCSRVRSRRRKRSGTVLPVTQPNEVGGFC